jgi:lipoic acid synthetase
VLSVFHDLLHAGANCLTVGQYLRPSKEHLPVVEYIHPDQFNVLAAEAYRMGFLHVAAGPLVRSSYHAGEVFGT